MNELEANAKIALWAATFSIIATLTSKRACHVSAYLLSLAVSVPIGTLAGALVSQHGWTGSEVYFVVAIASLLAQDIVKFLFSFSGFIHEKSNTLFEVLFDFILNRINSTKGVRKDRDSEQNSRNGKVDS